MNTDSGTYIRPTYQTVAIYIVAMWYVQYRSAQTLEQTCALFTLWLTCSNLHAIILHKHRKMVWPLKWNWQIVAFPKGHSNINVIAFNLLRSQKVKSDAAIGLLMCDVLLVCNSYIWPNSTLLWVTKISDMSHIPHTSFINIIYAEKCIFIVH